jgi:hypothetical protein
MCIFNALLVEAQDTIVGRVISEDNLGVPYANIVCFNRNYGATADSLGHFTLQVKSPDHQFKVSSIGFKNQTVSSFELSNDSIICMKTIVIELNEVMAIGDAKKHRNKTVGWRLRKRNHYMASLPGNHFATKIDCRKGWAGSYIESIQFLIAKMGNSHSPLRIRILKVNAFNRPGEDLLHTNKIIRDYNSDTYETISVDLKSYGIKIPPEGVFVSIEWLDVWNEGDSGIRSFYCTRDYIRSKKDTKRQLPSPAIAMSRNKAPFSLRNFRDKQWHPMSSNCRINVEVTLRKIID